MARAPVSTAPAERAASSANSRCAVSRGAVGPANCRPEHPPRLVAVSQEDEELREAEEEEGPLQRIRDLEQALFSPLNDRIRLDLAWPLLAFLSAALLCLIPFNFHAPYFAAMAQVLPVLLVAVFVEMAIMHRIFMPVVAETFDYRYPDPHRSVFRLFQSWVRAMLRLALIGLTATLIALATDCQSSFLGWLVGISAGGTALSLAAAFTQRLAFYQLLQRRTPGGPPQV